MLTSANGQCIRFAVDEVRVFKGRNSIGVRGINLAKGDKLISMTILRHIDVSAEERAAYLRMRRAIDGETEAEVPEEAEEGASDGVMTLSQERYIELSAAEEFVLTVSERGFGKRTSSYEYRVTGRGGKGIVAMAVNAAQRQADRLVPGFRE